MEGFGASWHACKACHKLFISEDFLRKHSRSCPQMNPVVRSSGCSETVTEKGRKQLSYVDLGHEEVVHMPTDTKRDLLYSNVNQCNRDNTEDRLLTSNDKNLPGRRVKIKQEKDDSYFTESEFSRRDGLSDQIRETPNETMSTVVKVERNENVSDVSSRDECALLPNDEMVPSQYPTCEKKSAENIRKCLVCGTLCVGSEALITHLYTHASKESSNCWSMDDKSVQVVKPIVVMPIEEGSTHQFKTVVAPIVTRSTAQISHPELMDDDKNGAFVTPTKQLKKHQSTTIAMPMKQLRAQKIKETDAPHFKSNNTQIKTFFECDHCKQMIKGHAKFERHKLIHINVKSFKCDLCDEVFKRKASWRYHRVDVHCKWPYQCEHCNEEFRSYPEFRKHMIIHTKPKPKGPKLKQFHCDQCDKSFSFKSGYRIHYRRHTGERPYKCDQCDKAFTQLNVLEFHKRTHSGEKPHTCDQCGRTFTQKGNLENHIMRAHNKADRPYMCDVCDKGFVLRRERDQHMRIHTGEKPYQCDTCGESFRIKQSLTFHLLNHSGLKPHECNLCKRQFRKRTQLTEHYRMHTDYRPYKCEYCDMAFTRYGSLRPHLLLHTDKKNYKCDYCDSAFHLKSGLDKHRIIHTGEKPHKCTQCGDAFAHSASLAAHLAKHAGIKHTCDVCGKSYTRKGDMTRHKRVTHEKQGKNAM